MHSIRLHVPEESSLAAFRKFRSRLLIPFSAMRIEISRCGIGPEFVIDIHEESSSNHEDLQQNDETFHR